MVRKKVYCLGVIFSIVLFSATFGYSQIPPGSSFSEMPVSGLWPRKETKFLEISQTVLPPLERKAWLPEGIDYRSNYLEPAIKGFNAMIEPNTGLPYDVVSIDGMRPVGPKVSGLEIGLQVLNVIIQRDLNLITSQEAISKMSKILDSINRAAKQNDFLYEFVSLPDLKKAGDVNDVFNSGSLAVALMIAHQAFQGTDIEKRCQKVLDEMDFNFFYNSRNGQLFGDSRKDYSIGQFGSEGLLSAIVAVLTDGVPETVFAPSRTIPIYATNYITSDGREIKVIPSWGGQIWTILLPLLFLGPEVDDPATPERENLIQGFIENARRWVEIQAEVAKKERLSIWGWSPCAVVSSRYDYDGTNGVPGLEEYGDAGEPRNNPVATYVSFLALGALTGYGPASPQLQATVENLQQMVRLNPSVRSPHYAFVDSIAQDGRVAPFLLALDKGMEVVGMFNAYQRSKGRPGIEDYFWQYLEARGMAAKARELLRQRSEIILQKIGAEIPASQLPVTPPQPITPPIIKPELPRMDIVVTDFDHTIRGPFGSEEGGDYLDSALVYDSERGAVLKLDYRASSGRGGFAFDVFVFDKVSIPRGMNYLVVDIKGIPKTGTQFPREQLKIELKQDPRVVGAVYTNEPFGSEWTTLYIPLSGLPSWIDALGFVLESHRGSQSGMIYIDRIGFAKKKP